MYYVMVVSLFPYYYHRYLTLRAIYLPSGLPLISFLTKAPPYIQVISQLLISTESHGDTVGSTKADHNFKSIEGRLKLEVR